MSGPQVGKLYRLLRVRYLNSGPAPVGTLGTVVSVVNGMRSCKVTILLCSELLETHVDRTWPWADDWEEVVNA